MSNNYNKKNKINYEKEGVFYTPEKSPENSGTPLKKLLKSFPLKSQNIPHI